MSEKLKFQKMWEAANVFVYDIDTGTILPLMETLPKVSSFADKHFLFYFDGKVGGAYFEEGEMKKSKESGFTDFMKEKYREGYFEGIRKTMSRFEDYFDEVKEKNVSKLKDSEIIEYLKKGLQIVIDIFGYYTASQPQSTLKLEEYIQEKLEEYVPEDRIREVFTLLSTPTEITKIRSEEIDWLTIVLRAKESGLGIEHAQVKEEIRKHHKIYYLLNAADGNKPYEENYFLTKFNNDNSLEIQHIKDKLEEISLSADKIKEMKENAIKKYNISKDIIDVCDLLAKLGHERLHMRISGWMPAYYYNEKLLEEFGKRKGISEDLIRFMSYKEITELFTGKKISLDLLKERKKGFIVIMNGNDVEIYGGTEAKKKFDEIVGEKDSSNVKEVKGNIAMKGQVKGRVLLFKWGDNIQAKLEKMGDDAILVAGQTRPQLMPLIVKSKAIVADEGGITSHAAIVSRELGVPCIIGTKIGTKVFKDGDFVEVDANKGIVRKIN